MKKQILAALAFCALSVATAAYAGVPAGTGILGSGHDMRKLTGVTNEDPANGRVCAFCHTPHHAATTGADYLPLWSRDQDVTPFMTAYNSSTIEALELNQNSDKAIGPTRLCMSCHDGTIAPDQHYASAGNVAGLSNDSWNGMGVGAGAIGLTNDHPVGFSYTDVAVGPSAVNSVPDQTLVQAAALAGQDAWIRQADATYLNNQLGITIQERLYQSGGKGYMTCATCHDVHNRKNKYVTADAVNYFVLAGQKDSDLCLSCHIK